MLRKRHVLIFGWLLCNSYKACLYVNYCFSGWIYCDPYIFYLFFFGGGVYSGRRWLIDSVRMRRRSKRTNLNAVKSREEKSDMTALILLPQIRATWSWLNLSDYFPILTCFVTCTQSFSTCKSSSVISLFLYHFIWIRLMVWWEKKSQRYSIFKIASSVPSGNICLSV